MLDILRPFFIGDWTPYGESLELERSSLAAPSIACWLAVPEHLDEVLARHAGTLRATGEARAVASDWMLRYFSALLPPVVAALTLAGRAIPTSWHEMTLTVNGQGAPVLFQVRHTGLPLELADTATRYEALVWRHLQPLIALVSRRARLPRKIAWGNAHRTLTNIFAQALVLVGKSSPTALRLLADQQQLLESRTWPDGRGNPLFLRQRRVALVTPDSRSESLTLHATCCLAYRLPSTAYCNACPLDPTHSARRARDMPPVSTSLG